MPSTSRPQTAAAASATGHDFRSQSRLLLALGLPLIGSHVAQFALHVTDSIMLGWYGATELAAGALAVNLFFAVFTLGSGFAHAVMPMVAASAARGDGTEVRRITRMGLWLTLTYGVLVLPLFLMSGRILEAMGQDPRVAALSGEYLAITGFGMGAWLMVMTLKSFLAALGRTKVVLWVTLGALAINVPLNWLMIFGNLGFPELGVRGAAITSLFIQCMTLLVLATYAVRHPALRTYQLAVRFWRPDWAAMRRVALIGVPIGLALLAETTLFAASAVMAGWLSADVLAAHAIALEITAMFFMIHLGLSNAATVLVGRARGRGDLPGLRAAARTGVILSTSVALVTMLIYFVFGSYMVGLFLSPSDPHREIIVPLGITLLMVAAVFQLGDGGQAMAMGLLRGMEDTRAPMLIATVSYWLIGIPIGYTLAFIAGWGGVGLWMGMVAGLFTAALALMIRFWRSVRLRDGS